MANYENIATNIIELVMTLKRHIEYLEKQNEETLLGLEEVMHINCVLKEEINRLEAENKKEEIKND